MTSKSQFATKVGSFLLVMGCLIGLFSIANYATVSLGNVFYDIYSGGPPPHHGTFKCPMNMRLNESGQISASISNPSAYRIRIDAPTFDVVPSGNGRWTITPRQVGDYDLSFTAYAYEDLDRPGVPDGGGFVRQIYSNSFTDNCFVRVTSLPIDDRQMLLLSGISALLGIVLVLPALARKITQRRARHKTTMK
jgi:hypothetical protein